MGDPLDRSPGGESGRHPPGGKQKGVLACAGTASPLPSGLAYRCAIDSIGLDVVIGSACRCRIRQPSSSRRKTVVTRREVGVSSSEPLSLRRVCSIHSTKPRSSVAYSEIRSNSTGSPSRHGTVQGLLYLAPSARRGAEWIGESDDIAPGPQPLLRLRVSSHNGMQRLLVRLNASGQSGGDIGGFPLPG